MDRLALEPQENTSPYLAMLANNAHIAIGVCPNNNLEPGRKALSRNLDSPDVAECICRSFGSELIDPFYEDSGP